MPFDALNCGNHELYDNATMEAFRSTGYIASWGGRYLTSNLVNATDKQPLGSRYTVMVGPVSGAKVLTFGFMYDMQPSEGLCQAVGVVPVADAIESDWFAATLRNEGRGADAVVVLAHMDARDPLLAAITAAVRAVLPLVAIQIIAGHSHRRDFAMIDDRTAVFEPGNY